MHRCGIFSRGLLLVFLLYFSPTALSEDDVPSTYGGYTLTEWKVLIKNNSLEELGSPRAVLGLVEIVTDQTVPAMSRRQAALTLGRIGAPATIAVPVFRLILKEEIDSQESQIWALKALALLGESAEIATADVAAIVRNSDRSLLERMQAVETLGKIGANHKDALVTLIQMLRDTERKPKLKELRMVVANGFWHLQEAASPALPELIRAAQDPWSLTRLAAIQSIGKIGPAAEVAIPILADTILFDDAGEVREAAADALASLGSISVPTLSQLSHDKEVDVRRFAIRGLSGINAPASMASLNQAVLEKAPIVRAEAARALLEMDQQHPKAIVVLLELITSDSREVSMTAYRSLLNNVQALKPHQARLMELQSEADQNSQRLISKLVDHLSKL